MSQTSDSLSTRVISTERIEKHINSLYHWIAAQTDDKYLIKRSQYLNKFKVELINVTNAKQIPSPGDQNAFDEYTLQPGKRADVSLLCLLCL